MHMAMFSARAEQHVKIWKSHNIVEKFTLYKAHKHPGAFQKADEYPHDLAGCCHTFLQAVSAMFQPCPPWK
jgi:hypothetical protein